MGVLDNFAVKFLFCAKKQKNQCFHVSLEMKFKSVFLYGACVGSCSAAIGSIQYLTNKMDTSDFGVSSLLDFFSNDNVQ